MMVTFEDISDPTSVRLVAPDDLESAFGEGVRLHEMTLLITEDRTSVNQVQDVLPWLKELRSGYIDGSRIGIFNPDNPLLSQLTVSSFSTEVNQ
jgi:hypothetical protein